MHGSCLCGEVQFRFERFDGGIAHCHCSMCRKFTGAAFATFGAVNCDEIIWEKAQSAITIFDSSEQAQRGFCKHCGSSLFYRLKLPNAPYEIALGLLDEEPSAAVTANIFCQNRPQWPRSLETLPAYEQGRV